MTNEDRQEILDEIAELKDKLADLQDEYETGSFYNWNHCMTWGEPPNEHFRSRDELDELISETEHAIEDLEEELEDIEEETETE